MFESDLSDVERNVIFSSIEFIDRARYLEIGINFAGTFKRVLDRNKGKDFFSLLASIFLRILQNI